MGSKSDKLLAMIKTHGTRILTWSRRWRRKRAQSAETLACCVVLAGRKAASNTAHAHLALKDTKRTGIDRNHHRAHHAGVGEFSRGSDGTPEVPALH